MPLYTFIAAAALAVAQSPSTPEAPQPETAIPAPIAAVERSDETREGRRLAAEIADIYWGHERLAETLLEAQAEFGFISDVVSVSAGQDAAGPALSAHAAGLEAEARERVRAAGLEHDLEALLARAPGAGNLLVRYIRYGADLETPQRLLDIMAPTAGPGGLHPSMLNALQGEVAARAQAGPAPAADTAAAPEPGDAQLDAFLAQYGAWIETVRLLGRLEGRDQFIRNLIIGQIARPLPDDVRSALIEANDPLIEAIDTENAAAALAIVDIHGLAAINDAAPRAAGLIASIIQHGSTDDQRRLLSELEPLALAGRFSGQRYALMFDRVAVNSGAPQRYGSQMGCFDGRFGLAPIEDEANVDTRRAEMGLAPLEDYRTSLIEMYGETC
jgi:hypothetical protein